MTKENPINPDKPSKIIKDLQDLYHKHSLDIRNKARSMFKTVTLKVDEIEKLALTMEDDTVAEAIYNRCQEIKGLLK